MAHAPHEHITSTSNPTIKMLRGLDRKKVRHETNLFLTEGARLITEALKFGWTPEFILVANEESQRKDYSEIVRLARAQGARILTTTPKILSLVSKKDNSQTILAAFKQQLSRLEDLPNNSSSRFIALYEIRDPGNLGTILRTADAAGIDGVILINNCCDPFSIECVRATMGALFSNTIVNISIEQFLAWQKAQDIQMIAASVNGQRRHDEIQYSEQSVLLMGNEQSGIPSSVEAQCTELVKIPMAGAADSLNLAQATAIMTYEIWKSTGYEGAND